MTSITLIVLFAIIGATINAGVAYWIFFSVFCLFRLIVIVDKVVKWLEENGELI